MNSHSTVTSKVPFLLLWIGIGALGWLLAPINALPPNLRTYLEVANRMLVYAGCGLIVGLALGAGQLLLLKQKWVGSKEWFWMTVVGYTFALPIGLAISTLIPAIAFRLQGSGFLPLREPGSLFYFPFPGDIVFGGWVVGVAQWIALRRYLPYRNSRLAALWILGVWLSVGLGIFALLIARSGPINLNSGRILDAGLALERVYAGGVSSLVAGLLLLFVIDQSGRKVKKVSPLAENIPVD
jgi:hypothetical protein